MKTALRIMIFISSLLSLSLLRKVRFWQISRLEKISTPQLTSVSEDLKFSITTKLVKRYFSEWAQVSILKAEITVKLILDRNHFSFEIDISYISAQLTDCT